MATLAMTTNSALVFFTMRDAYFPKDFPVQYLVWLFFGSQALIRVIVALVQAVVPDVPEFVQIQENRQTFLKMKIIERSNEVITSEGKESAITEV